MLTQTFFVVSPEDPVKLPTGMAFPPRPNYHSNWSWSTSKAPAERLASKLSKSLGQAAPASCSLPLARSCGQGSPAGPQKIYSPPNPLPAASALRGEREPARAWLARAEASSSSPPLPALAPATRPRCPRSAARERWPRPGGAAAGFAQGAPAGPASGATSGAGGCLRRCRGLPRVSVAHGCTCSDGMSCPSASGWYCTTADCHLFIGRRVCMPSEASWNFAANDCADRTRTCTPRS